LSRPPYCLQANGCPRRKDDFKEFKVFSSLKYFFQRNWDRGQTSQSLCPMRLGISFAKTGFSEEEKTAQAVLCVARGGQYLAGTGM
jgi:hypothetical protein